MREPFSTPLSDFIVHPKGAFLAHPQARFRRAHGKVFKTVELVKHEDGRLPAVHISARRPDSGTVRSHRDGQQLRGRYDKGRSSKTHLLSSCGAIGERSGRLGPW